MKPALLLLLLSGCASFDGGGDFTPTSTQVLVNVHWASLETIQRIARTPDALAVSTRPAPSLVCPGVSETHMWVIKPGSWFDYRAFELIGHELGHGLRAYHPKDMPAYVEVR